MDPRPSCTRVGLLVADDCVAAAEGEASSDLDRDCTRRLSVLSARGVCAAWGFSILSINALALRSMSFATLSLTEGLDWPMLTVARGPGAGNART